MPAPKHNSFFRFVKQPTGRPNAYTPDELWQKSQEYFEWVEKNPLKEMKAFANGKTKTLPKMRAMTEIAFCLFAGIDQDTFTNYKSGKEEWNDFFGVASTISKIIYVSKFEGAAADMLNPNIIARDLGLADKMKFDLDQLNDEQIDQLFNKYILNQKP